MMIYFMNLVLNILNPYFTKMSLILPHLHPFHLLSILLNLKKLPGILCSQLKITRRLKWLTLKNTKHLLTLNPNHLLFWINLILNPSKFTFMTIILHLIAHLKMWITPVISVTPPAPLTIWMNQVH